MLLSRDMSERILKILLSELAIIRLTCAHCKIVIEATPTQLGRILSEEGKCPFCPQPICHPLGPSNNGFTTLAKGLDQISALKDQAEIAFVLHTTDSETR